MNDWSSYFPISWMVQIFGMVQSGSSTGFPAESFEGLLVLGYLIG